MLNYMGYLTAGSTGHGPLLSSTLRYGGSNMLVFPCVPPRRLGIPRRTIIAWRGSDTTKQSASSLHANPASGDLTGETKHSEQRPGYRPPLPLEDDGHIVDLSLLQYLLDSGSLQIARRPVDYGDRRTDGYTEPLEIYVLGTSHASEASARDVERVIRAVRPQSVVVELCKSRAGLMMPSAESNVTAGPLTMYGDNIAATVIRSLRLGGQSTALLRAALAWAAQGSMEEDGKSAKPSDAMYGEFRAARESAEEVALNE